METPPQSAWDRDPEGTYRTMHAEIDREAAKGHLVKGEIARLRNAAGKCYLKAKARGR